MQEINIKVDDKDLETVLLILNNLKSGLIKELKCAKELKRSTQYQPKSNKVIYEDETNSLGGKYLNPSAYKAKLGRR